MKNLLTFITLFTLTNLFSQVPFSFVSGGVNYAANGNTSHLFETNDLSAQGSQFKFNLTNTSGQPLVFKTQIIGLTNYSAGQELAFCYAYFCEFDVVLNQIYPPADEPFLMNPGENMNTVGENDCKFQNTSAGTDPNAIKEFVIRFFAENPDTNVQVGDAFVLTFRYNPNLSSISQSLENFGVQLQSTLINSEINVICKEKTQMSLVDITGKSLLNVSLNEGLNNINADFLNAGVYVLSFETSSNKRASQKIIKK